MKTLCLPTTNAFITSGMEAVAKSTLSEAMNLRNPEIFKALFEEILDRVMAIAPKHKFKFKNPLYAIDSTTIDLCLSRYNWAYYRKHKGAVKLHTELDLSGNLPCFLLMSNGKMSDIRAAKENIPILRTASTPLVKATMI